jgi:hypothetical protein
MAIVLTTQPVNNGYYTAYLPVEFTATETATNPSYLVFRLRNANGTNITGVPDYNAPLINGSYKFNASQVLKSLFDVRTDQGLSVTTIEELTDLYKKVEVLITDPTGAVSSLVSNEFFAFPFLDTLRFANDQTANNGISNKKMLYCDNGIRKVGTRGRVNMFVKSGETLTIDTYLDNLPLQIGIVTFDLTSYVDKLISIPLTRSAIIANWNTPSPFIGYNRFRLYTSTTEQWYEVYTKCNTKEFVFVNKYGVKESLLIESKDFEKVATKSSEFERATSGLVGLNFNTGATGNKVNQEHSREFSVQGQRFTINYKETVSDFVRSPKHWLNIGGQLYPILVFDQAFTLVDNGRGVDLEFRYKMAQKELAFL